MAVVLVLGASILGLILAITAYLVFDIGLLLALGLWSGIGILAVCLGLLLAVLADSRRPCDSGPPIGTARTG